MGHLGATLTEVFTRVRGADVSLRDVTIAQIGNGTSKCESRHALEARGGFGEFWRKWVENWTPNEKGWFSLARGGPGQVSHEMEGRWKSQNRKNVYLSPYVEKPLNSKVIKSFVPELRSRYVFFEFRDSYVLYMYIYMNIICPFQT